MTLYYSASTGGFYDAAIHGEAIPADAVEISADTYAALLEGQDAGRLIVSNPEGAPVLADRPAPTPDQLAARGRLWRDGEITASQWLVERHRDQLSAGESTNLSAEQYSVLLTYRQALRDWPAASGFPADASRPAAPDWLAAVQSA